MWRRRFQAQGRGGDDRHDSLTLAQAPESDDPGRSIGLAARRLPPGWDVIGLGQMLALRY